MYIFLIYDKKEGDSPLLESHTVLNYKVKKKMYCIGTSSGVEFFFASLKSYKFIVINEHNTYLQAVNIRTKRLLFFFILFWHLFLPPAT